MLVIIWTAVIITALILYFRQIYTSFSRHGVKCFTPIPVLGNMGRVTMKLDHFTADLERLYNGFPDERFVGRYEFMNPLVLIRSIDLAKQIAVKDFEHFLDHRMIINEKTDPLFGRNLFALRGQEWKDMRSTLSPAFTSSKMKLMVPFMVEVGDQMIRVLKKKLEDSGVGYIDVDCKDLSTRYANDVIASCAFGLKVDSHTDNDNEFYKMGKAASTFNYKQMLIFFGFASFPKLMEKFKINLFSEESKRFFRDIVINTMLNRESKNIVRPDMIHLLMEAKKGQLTHEDKSVDVDAGFATVEESVVGKKEVNRVWSNDDLTAQAVVFFLAGFEAISVAMSFALHELALHPDIQDKLYQEIIENDRKNNGKIDYNSIQSMKYLDMVVSEVLRLWPAAIALDRNCLKDYNLGKPNSAAKEDYILRKGVGVFIPVWCFHRDPKYFPDPLKFDPERFNDENKHLIKPFTYLPFGVGPRNCIGSRFALCEVKVMLYQLLQHMEVSPCEKTSLNAKLSKDSFNLRIEGGHWLRMRARK